ncbi:MAG: hypothetical protein N3B01_03695 [Verrucomicrobiae bacterium]|nr:hypothetical protein [Verrucomicrobiae bacterium]
MRTTLTAMLLCAVLSLSTGARAAEAGRPGGERAERGKGRFQEMIEKLGLNDSQKEKFRALWQSQMEKMKEIYSDSNLSQEQKREKMKAIREEFTPKFKEILTPEQFEKWEKMREEARGKIGERVKQRRDGEK